MELGFHKDDKNYAMYIFTYGFLIKKVPHSSFPSLSISPGILDATCAMILYPDAFRGVARRIADSPE